MNRVKIISLLASASLLSMASPALAQAETDNGASTEGEIIVTAQRRDESLSKTPVAVAVLSADTLANAQVVSEQDLRTATPGLTVRATISSNQLNYSLRGQSQDAYSGTRPGVLPYINEVQIGGSSGSTAFYDLQSVQVLKGPQGTLFGRSATGGAVLFTTAKPTDEFGGYVSATAGNYGALKFEGAVNAPLAGDKLMARLAAFYQERKGFQRNLFDGGREGDLQRTGVRGSLTAQLSDSIKNELVVDFLNSDSESTLGVVSGLQPFTGGGAGNPPFIPLEFLYAGVDTPVATQTGIGTVAAFIGAINPATGAVLNQGLLDAATAFYTNYFADPRHPSGGLRGFLASQNAAGPFVISADGANFYRADNIVVTNATTFEIGDNTRIKNIFGYTDADTAQTGDEGTPFGISQTTARGTPGALLIKARSISNELQLQGETSDGGLKYVAGVYFSDEKTTTRQFSSFFDILLGVGLQENNFVSTAKTYAGYAQATYALNDTGLSVTGGIRYTSEKQGKRILPDDTVRLALGPVAPPGFSYDQRATFNNVSWQLGIQNQFSPELLVYAVSRRAYKSGGFNGTVAPRVGFAEVAGDAFREEQVTDAEIGLKYANNRGAVPIRANLALFHNWVSNGQRAAYSLVNGAPSALTVNVPKGRVYGVEFDAVVKPANWLSLGGTFNYTHSRFSGTAVGATALVGCTGATIIANAARLCYDVVPDTPETSGTIFADVTVPLTDAISATFHGDVYHQSVSNTSPRSGNSAGTVVRGYTLANFRVGVEDKNAGWSLTANLKNAFNKVHYVGGIPTGEIYQLNTLLPGDPRTFTVEARFKF
jgi:iron complex outermembrane recepter protein